MPQLIRAKLSALHFQEIGPDEERRLDHAHKNMHRRSQAKRAADPECVPEQEGETANDALEYAPIEHDRRQRTDHKNQGKSSESENKARAGRDLGKRQRRAPKIAENEAGAGVGCLLQGSHTVIEHEEERGCRWKFD